MIRTGTILGMLMALLLPMLCQAEPDDPRMQVSLYADESHGITLQQLHTDISGAASMALPVIWQRILSAAAISSLPRRIKATRFLQRATPTERGVDITFSRQRIDAFLKKQGIAAFDHGESETASANAPVSQPQTQAPSSFSRHNYLTLSVERSASLAQQVLFEDELQRDPRILELSLKQVNRSSRKYRLLLSGADDQWMMTWFARRGMTLTPTIEGWVARRQ